MEELKKNNIYERIYLKKAKFMFKISKSLTPNYKASLRTFQAELNLLWPIDLEQVAQWATIAHLGASIMFGDTLIYDDQRQVTLNLKQ